MNKFASRRFILACSIELASTIGLYVGNLDSGDFTAISIAVMGAYSLNRAWETEKSKNNE